MISFNQVPNGMRVPFLYAEFDASNAQQGNSVMPYQMLCLGQMLSSGTATANVPVLVSSVAQAISLFGAGSMLHAQVERILAANSFTPLWVIPQADAGSSVAATGTIVITGPATAAGTISLYVAGRQILVGVNSGDSVATIGANIVAAANAVNDLPVSAAFATATLTFTARNKGPLGNNIDIRLNYFTSDAPVPTGVTLTITAMSGGTGAPSISAAISAMGEVQYNVILMAYNDATNIGLMNVELVSRWGPLRQNDGVAFICDQDTQGNLVTFGSALNTQFLVCAGIYQCPMPSYEISASMGAVVAYYANQDPARPFQTLPLPGILAPALSARFTLLQRNVLLNNGIATLNVDSSGNVLIERAVTTYQKNSAGAPDTSYLDVNTVLTLSFLRYDFRNMWLTKYARYKLGADGTRFGPGQAIITPGLGAAEAIAKFGEWETAGYVQNLTQFKKDLICEINPSDPNRLDFLLPPNLINQLMVTGVQIGFLL
jgi:phage tail sheath gpL-like